MTVKRVVLNFTICLVSLFVSVANSMILTAVLVTGAVFGDVENVTDILEDFMQVS